MEYTVRSSQSTESFKNKHNRSTVFLSTIEQADISMKKTKPHREILNLQRDPIQQRSSNTYYSSIFQPNTLQSIKKNPLKPKDNITSNYLGNDPSDFYRKSIVSDFTPNFKPKFSYQPVWSISSDNILPESKTEKNNWIKPIIKNKTEDKENTKNWNENDKTSNYKTLYNREKLSVPLQQKSTRPTSKASSRLQSRAVTPQPIKDSFSSFHSEVPEKTNLYTETSENLYKKIETDPDSRKNNFRHINRYSSIIYNSRNITPLLDSARNYSSDTLTDRSDKRLLNSNDHFGKICANRDDFAKKCLNPDVFDKDSQEKLNHYSSILRDWCQDRFLSKLPNFSKKVQPNYMRNTISSVSKAKKQTLN